MSEVDASPLPEKVDLPKSRPTASTVGRLIFALFVAAGCFVVILSPTSEDHHAAAIAVLVLVVNAVLQPASQT